MVRIVIDYETDPDFSCCDEDERTAAEMYVSLYTALYDNSGNLVGSLSDSLFYENADDWTTGSFSKVEDIPARCPHLREVAANLIAEHEADLASEPARHLPKRDRLIAASEVPTLLAALRYWQWQRHRLIIDRRVQDILDIENDDGTIDTMTDGEIDALCKRINTGG